MAAWMSDLDRILQVFKVRSTIPSLPAPFTIYFQTELALSTHVAVSDIRHDVASTREIVSEIHRTVVKGQGGAIVGNRTVGNQCALIIIVKT